MGESAVSRWETGPSEVIATVAPGGGVGGGGAPVVVSRWVVTPR
jgi:hypothetical protein